jgi:hypothetical protein
MSFDQCDIMILGTGNLAAELACALSMDIEVAIKVCICGRNDSQANNIALISNTRAKLMNAPSTFSALKVSWSDEDLRKMITKRFPKIIIVMASLQSPWTLSNESEWSLLIKRFGFGSTAPLQCELLIKIARIVQSDFPQIIVLNACYPDVCNEILTMLGFDVFAGLGNVAILEAIFRNVYGLDSTDSIQIIGHHFHVNQLINRTEGDSMAFPRIWINGKEQMDLKEKIKDVKIPSDAMLNKITAATMLTLLKCLIFNNEGNFNIPGPKGLPGGYPVHISQGSISINLPIGVQLGDMIQRNKQLGSKEGVSVKNNKVYLNSDVIQYLSKTYPTLEIIKLLEPV